MTNCIHCDKPKDAHCSAFGHLVCPGVRGRMGTLSTYECDQPKPNYEVVDTLKYYEALVLTAAIPIYVGLAARHPDDAEGDHNQAIAVREAKRLITRVVRDARRQDR